MWELYYKEGWAPKNWCFQTVVLENTLQSPMDSKEIQPVHSKGNQPWIFTGRTDAEAEYSGHMMRPANSLEKTLMLGRLRAGESDDRGWQGWMALPTQWTRVWANSWSQWRAGKPGVLQSTESQRVRRGWVTEHQPYGTIEPALPRFKWHVSFPKHHKTYTEIHSTIT